MAHINELNLALLILPVSRNSIFSSLFNLSFHRVLAYHRLIGAVAFASVTCHFALWWRVWYEDEPDWAKILKCAIRFEGACEDQWQAITGQFSYLCMTIMVLFALPPIRRRFFRLFYLAHHLFVPAYILAILHSVGVAHSRGHLLKYLSFTFSLYIIDRGIRFIRSRAASIHLVRLHRQKTEVTRVEIEFSGKPIHYKAGQFLMVNVPEIAFDEWHPFSISSAPLYHRDSISLHVRAMESGNFTHKLGQLARHGNPVSLKIGGPYGNPPCAGEHSVLLMMAGGIGITPLMSVLANTYAAARAGLSVGHLRHVILIWVVKAPLNLLWFANEIAEIRNEKLEKAASPRAHSEKKENESSIESLSAQVGPVKFTIKLFVTNSKFHTRQVLPNDLHANPKDEALLKVSSDDAPYVDSSSSSSTKVAIDDADDGSLASDPLPAFTLGRPNIDLEVAAAYDAADSVTGLRVFGCGPEGLLMHIREARQLLLQRSMLTPVEMTLDEFHL